MSRCATVLASEARWLSRYRPATRISRRHRVASAPDQTMRPQINQRLTTSSSAVRRKGRDPTRWNLFPANPSVPPLTSRCWRREIDTSPHRTCVWTDLASNSSSPCGGSVDTPGKETYSNIRYAIFDSLLGHILYILYGERCYNYVTNHAPYQRWRASVAQITRHKFANMLNYIVVNVYSNRRKIHFDI